jgi:hypothetical protein
MNWIALPSVLRRSSRYPERGGENGGRERWEREGGSKEPEEA